MKFIKHMPFVHMEVTPECNHNCIHCYNYWRKNEECEKFKFDSQRSIEIAKRVIANKPYAVVITGGEPLLVFKQLKPVIKLFKDNEIQVSINTNAALINESVIDFAKQYNLRFFVSFPSGDSDTCDFITNRKDSLKHILKSLDALKENNLVFNLNIVASKINLKQIFDSASFVIQRYNLKRIYITRVGKPINSDASFDKYLLTTEDIKELQNICVGINRQFGVEIDTGCPFPACGYYSQEAYDIFANKKVCTAGKSSYAIDSYGNIKACPRDSKIYGNIFEDELVSVFEKMEEWRDYSLLPEECKECKKKIVCQGGCRVDMVPFTGKMNSMDSCSNKANLATEYVKKVKPHGFYEPEDVFEFNSDCQLVEEEFGIRVDTKRTYTFLVKTFVDWLQSVNTFTFEQLADFVAADNPKEVYYIMDKLLSNNVVIKKQKGEKHYA